MNNLINTFGSLYYPKKAFLIYEQKGNPIADKVYIESYDISAGGNPVNAHPLSQKESCALARALRTNEDKKGVFLKAKGIMPRNLLYLNMQKNPYAVWHTPKQNVKLLFSEGLGIDCGIANIPALVWKASKEGLGIYAVADDVLNEDTALCYAPFFNVYKDGKVCMGNVQLTIPRDCCLEDFMSLWQNAFFNSYFSHMMQNHNPVQGNMVQLWKSLVNKTKLFPAKSLIQSKATLKHLIQ